MSLTYDQRSEIRIAFDEAYVPPDRRRGGRIPFRVDAEVAPWKRNKQGNLFSVRIEDFSPSGVGLICNKPMPVESEYLLRIPRVQLSELVVLLRVVRCRATGDGAFNIGLELSSVMDLTNGRLYDALKGPPHRVTRLTKVLFCLFGIAGIGTSLLIN